MIRPGEVAFIKTTGEAVFVMSVHEDGKTYVRRPISGQNGITHTLEYFTVPELETQEEQRKRFLAERKELSAFFTTPGSEAPSDPDPGFGLN